MRYTRLGRTDLNVSRICLGTMTWGQQNSEAEAHAQMDYAVGQGINFFDTAEMYPIPPKAQTQGTTERFIGSWFKAHGNRDKIILASKVAGRADSTWYRDDGAATELSPKQIHEAIDKSLKRLGTDYIDLYQVHWPDRPMPWGSNPTIFHHLDDAKSHPLEETLDVLGNLVKAGKVRHIGVSNESAWGTMRLLRHSETHGLPRVASIQNAYNLVNRTYETALAEIGLREDVGLLAYSPLGQGYLTGKYLDGARPAGARTTLFKRGQRYEKPGAEKAIRAYVELAKEIGLDPATLAIAFVDAQPFVTSTIIGATTIEQLRTDIAAGKVVLSEDILKRIDAIHLLNCSPCP